MHIKYEKLYFLWITLFLSQYTVFSSQCPLTGLTKERCLKHVVYYRFERFYIVHVSLNAFLSCNERLYYFTY